MQLTVGLSWCVGIARRPSTTVYHPSALPTDLHLPKPARPMCTVPCYGAVVLDVSTTLSAHGTMASRSQLPAALLLVTHGRLWSAAST